MAVTLTITLEQGIVFSAFHGVNEAVLRGGSEVDIAGRMQRFEQKCSISIRLMGLTGQGQQEMPSRYFLQSFQRFHCRMEISPYILIMTVINPH